MVSTGPFLSAIYSDNVDDNNNNNATVVIDNISSSRSSSGSSSEIVVATAVGHRENGSHSSPEYSTTDGTTGAVLLHKLQIEEILVLVIILVMWGLAVLSFLRKWSRIRILQPMEPRYRHNPKNLENVLVVKRAQDSIIYKNYGRKMSVTMVAREKRRLQRLHTLSIFRDLPLLSHVHHELPTPTSPEAEHSSPSGDRLAVPFILT